MLYSAQALQLVITVLHLHFKEGGALANLGKHVCLVLLRLYHETYLVQQAQLSCVTEMPDDMQDLDKKDAVAEKQRESMMVGLSKTKTELGSLQDALAKTQVELEKTNFELHAKQSKHMSPVPVLSCCMPISTPRVTSDHRDTTASAGAAKIGAWLLVGALHLHFLL